MRLLNPPSFPSVGLLSLRIVVGITFLVHGLHKLTDLAGAERLFTSYSIPAPGVMAVFVGVVETEGGLLLIAGLATQLAAAVLAGDMVVALLTAHDDLRFFATEGGIELEVLLLGACLALVLAGAGRLSLDDLFRRLPAEGADTQPAPWRRRAHDPAPADAKVTT
jgi:putative oxidoreductase